MHAWPAPAKINRFLHITGRREDGYHLLQTVFQFLDYCDELVFTPRRDHAIRRVSEVHGVPAEQDLVVRAARLLQSYTETDQGVEIAINKRLPMGGGLGGGSSDAATTLVALNHVWKTGLTEQQLAGLGLQLGADVPIFIHGHAAWAEGVGEVIQAIELDQPWFLVVVPDQPVSTAGIFRDPELTRDTPVMKIADFLAGGGHNDCEALVCKRHPVIGEMREWMRRHLDHSAGCIAHTRMTGTGACLFTGFAEQDQAHRMQASLPAGWKSFVAQGLNESPLHARLSREG